MFLGLFLLHGRHPFFPLKVFCDLSSFKEDRDGLRLKVLLVSSWKDICGLFGPWPNCPDFAGYASPSCSVWPSGLGLVGLWGEVMRRCMNIDDGNFLGNITEKMEITLLLQEFLC